VAKLIEYRALLDSFTADDVSYEMYYDLYYEYINCMLYKMSCCLTARCIGCLMEGMW